MKLFENELYYRIHESGSIEYEVLTHNDTFSYKEKFLKDILNKRKCLIVISKTISKLYGNLIEKYFHSEIEIGNIKVIIIETGEDNKNISNVKNVVSEAKKFNLDRRGVFLAIGGGILMDIVGFSSAIYKRKTSYIKIPTTLLGQVDAGIGVKNGVNILNKKNLIGSYHPPEKVIIDRMFLKTLEKKDIEAGLAEMIKIAISLDEDLFKILESNLERLIDIKFQSEVGLKVIISSVVGMLDELCGNFEEYYLERIVDFGHSFSPYIEEKSNYSISHGHAVAMDMAISTKLSYDLGYLKENDRDRILDLLYRINEKIYNYEMIDSDEMFRSLESIVVHRNGDLNLVVPTGIGKSTFISSIISIDSNVLDDCIKSLQNRITCKVGNIC